MVSVAAALEMAAHSYSVVINVVQAMQEFRRPRDLDCTFDLVLSANRL